MNKKLKKTGGLIIFSMTVYDWIRSPFTVTTASRLSPDMEDALVELSSDRTLKTAFNLKTFAEFWISVEREYPQLSKAAMDVLDAVWLYTPV